MKNSNNIGTQASFPKYRYDNFIISAVDTVPLNIQEWISSKFNVFPNPMTDIVTITNNENIGIEEIMVYDVSGKLINSIGYQNEIQLNLSNLSLSTYLLHIKTNQGTAKTDQELKKRAF